MVFINDSPAGAIPRTPNGAADLLSGDDNTDPPRPFNYPSNLFLDGDEENGSQSLPSHAAPPSHAFSIEDTEKVEIYGDDNNNAEKDNDSFDGNIYDRLDSFEEKLENELRGLEEFGVVSGRDLDDKGARAVTPPKYSPSKASSSADSTSDELREFEEFGAARGLDPDGKGARAATPPKFHRTQDFSADSTTTASTADASSSSSSWSTVVSAAVKSASSSAKKHKRGRGRGNIKSKRLSKLSSKTTKIMSDYQNYLTEIQTGFAYDDEDQNDPNGDNSSALAGIHQARENVRDSYASKAEEGGRRMSPPPILPKDPAGLEKDDNYATGGGTELLQRAWTYGNPNDNNVPQYDKVYDRVMLYGGIGRKRQSSYNDDHKSLVQSKKAKRGIAMIALTAFVMAIVCISMGVSNRRNNASIQNEWEAEYEPGMQQEHEEDLEMTRLRQSVAPDWKGFVTVGLANNAKAQQGRDDDGSVDTSEEINDRDGWKGGNWAELEGNGEEYAAEMEEEKEQEAQAEAEEQEYADKMEAEEELKKDFYSEMEQEEEDEIITTKHDEAPSILDWQAESTFTNKEDQTIDDPYYDAVIKYRPVMYDRSHGWNGQTYREALVFCEVTAGLAVCPYEAICPLGTSGEPFGGYRDAPHGDWAWVPIINGDNEWVQVGARDRCGKYGRVNNERPDWGMSGEDNEDVTRNIMCCLNVHDHI